MTTRLLSSNSILTLTAVAALALSPACKKEPTQPPVDVADPGDGADLDEPADEALAALPPQDPDPAELAALFEAYLKGDYEAVIAGASDLISSLTADTQIRARALASAIRALAAIENVPEDGQSDAAEAVAAGDRLGDPEVLQLAHVAHGGYLVRVHEAERGQAELEGAVGLEGPYVALANLMLGEAHLNQAFGVGEEDSRIMNPGKLDDARAAYQAALDGVQLLQAHAHDGLAAVAKYKNENKLICDHAQQAENLYAANGATDHLREVPSLLARDGRCKSFKKAK
jgi:hypothetical protein